MRCCGLCCESLALLIQSVILQSVAEVPTQTPGEESGRGRSRRWFLRGLAATGTVAISLDWGETWKDLFREPSQKVTAQAVPKAVPIYRTHEASRARPVIPTIYDSDAAFMRAADAINRGDSVGLLERQAQSHLFDRFHSGTVVSIGHSRQEDKWREFAKTEASRITGIPTDALPQPTTSYGQPATDVARFALLRTMTYAAPLPRRMLAAVAMSESGYVAGMSVRVAAYDASVDNGISDTVHSAIMVDCMEGEDVRKGVGRQWLRQYSMLLDAYLSQSPTTYNDREFSELVPELVGIEQDRLDYPTPGDDEVFGIASTKAARLTDILSGNLILPGDDLFYSPEQVQQELLLRRIYGTFSDLPLNYFERLTEYKQAHDGALPLHGMALA